MIFKVHIIFIITFGLISLKGAHAEIFKCPDSNGTMVFTDKPCNSGYKNSNGNWISVEEEARNKEKEAKERLERERELIRTKQESIAKQKQEEERLRELERKKIKENSAREVQERLDRYCNGVAIDLLRVGLTEEQVINCTIYGYQEPPRINVTTNAAGTVKQYIYGSHNPTYLYFRNGVLTSFQN